MKTSVIIPTYMRPERLAGALKAIDQQERQPEELIVVCRVDDSSSRRLVEEHRTAQVAIVERPGVLAAMAAGASRSTGELIAFVDDDAEPPPDWLRRAVRTLEADESVGGYSARDVVRDPDDLERTDRVGLITRWGKLVGDHHRASGRPRDVDVLKAANMVFRREALQLPSELRGLGAQVHFEIASCLAAQAAGWRLRFDPEVAVRHLPGDRFDQDRRGAPSSGAVFNAAHNLVMTMLSFRPELYWRRAAYGLLLGDRATPGLLRALLALVRRETRVVRDFAPSVFGQLAALWELRRGRRVPMIAFLRSDDLVQDQSDPLS